ncbi:hypothetical protein EDD18DRAFT_1436517 [Armillaria luteobubalina]|uniref:Uncharacterized protein n=1 Tax=Armillaria luteobubalina TaxID=153913 RepID=A0AA39PBY8_9AGAR|nr:hypothetical protein EDD18DRAFT_1436517 [Armillaria luteobubalina]
MTSVTADKPQGDDSPICTKITKIGELIDTINKYEARILNLAGVGPELAEAHKYQDHMEEVQQWLEDILCGITEVMKQANGNPLLIIVIVAVIVIITGSRDHLNIISAQCIDIMGTHRGKRQVVLEDKAVSCELEESWGSLEGDDTGSLVGTILRDARGCLATVRGARVGMIPVAAMVLAIVMPPSPGAPPVSPRDESAWLGLGSLLVPGTTESDESLWKKKYPNLRVGWRELEAIDPFFPHRYWTDNEATGKLYSGGIYLYQHEQQATTPARKKISEVKAWLDSQVGEYMKKVTKEFNEKWVYPGYEEDELFQAQKKQIQQKFNKHHKATVAVVTNNLVGNPAVLMKKKILLFNLKPVQQLCAVQIYSQCYFPTHVWPYVNQTLKANMQPLGHRAKLNLSNHIMAKQFEAEMDAIKEKILAAMEEVHEEILEVEAKQSPADYLEAIDQAPALLQCLLFHIGETTHGHNFLDEYAAFSMDPDDPASQCQMFDESIIVPYGHFLKTLFSPQMRAHLQQCHMEDPHLPLNRLPLLPDPHNEAELEDEVEDEGGPGAPFIEEGAGASSNEGSTAAVAHISTIQSTKWKQYHIEEDDTRVNSEVRASKHACWLPSALGYLTDPALGLEWQEFLVKWQDLEGHMSQVAGHSPGKGHMGALSSRPSVLSLWLTNWHYNIYPNPLVSFSTELCKWWNAMQPIWHQNKAGILLLPVYNRSLQKNLWKGGQNRMVTILIGLMWWGQGTLEAEDRVLWKEMVADIDKCIQNIYTIYLPSSRLADRSVIQPFLASDDAELFRKGWARVGVDTITSNGAMGTTTSKVFGN